MSDSTKQQRISASCDAKHLRCRLCLAAWHCRLLIASFHASTLETLQHLLYNNMSLAQESAIPPSCEGAKVTTVV
eukprot:566752-Amphidinium_carterae.1